MVQISALRQVRQHGPLQRVLKTHPLTAGQLAACLAAAGVVFLAVEVEKAVKRRRPVVRR